MISKFLLVFLLITYIFTPSVNAEDNSNNIYEVIGIENEIINDYLWLDDGEFNQSGLEIYELINQAETKGLNNQDYLVSEINSIWMGIRYQDPENINEKNLEELDELLTRALLRYTSDIATGRFQPDTLEREMVNEEILEGFPRIIESIKTGRSVQDVISDYEPNHPYYFALLEALEENRDNFAYDQIQEIVLNLERWRMDYNQLPKNHLLVNIPSFRLELFEQNEIVLDMKTVVGNKNRPTPVIEGILNRMTISPRWFMPTSIAVEDHLPKVKEDVEHLEKGNYKVYTLENGNYNRVDPEEVDWDEVTADKDEFPYFFWQDSGPWNALGSLVFRFPNNQSIYLHDTPDQHYFELDDRARSSGCIRLEEPMELAKYLLSDMPEWPEEKLIEKILKKEETWLNLKSTLPIYITYFTVTPSEDGSLNFHDDIYDKNSDLRKVLDNNNN
ncbi:MAG: L,D-transpeptidase family protein [Bacillota bacterium]